MIQTMEFNPVISAPNTAEVRKLLSCWSSSGGAESVRGQGRVRNPDQVLPLMSCSHGMAHMVPTAMQCVCVHVCTTALYQVELHQFHNCAMQGLALDFSGENAGVLALS